MVVEGGARTDRNVFGDRIAQLLIGQGEITPAQVEEARRTQGFFGGGLETHLVKLGFIDESILGRALSEVTHTPYASSTQLLMIPLDALGAVPVDLILKYRVCPFRLEKKTLSIAMQNPKDAIAVAAVQSATKLEIDVWVTSDFRMEKALERHYGIKPRAKEGLALKGGVSSRPAAGSSRRGNEIPGVEAPVEPEIGLDGLPLDAEVSFDDHLFHHGAIGLPGEPGPTPPEAEVAGETTEEDGTATADPLELLEFRMGTALEGASIAESLLDFCAPLSPRNAVFSVGKNGIRCIAGRGRGIELDRLAGTIIPLDEGTVLDSALDRTGFYLGPVPPSPANENLYSLLGGRIPPLVMILQIQVGDRTVALLYLDDDEKPLKAPDVTLLRRIAAKAGLAFQILILRNRLRGL